MRVPVLKPLVFRYTPDRQDDPHVASTRMTGWFSEGSGNDQVMVAAYLLLQGQMAASQP